MRYSRGVGRQLAPWEQLPYFEPPKLTYFPNIGATIQVCDANPRRVALIFAAAGTANVWVLPDPIVSGDNGLELTTATPWFGLTHADYGSLVQVAWWAAVKGPGNDLTVIETILSKWPGE